MSDSGHADLTHEIIGAAFEVHRTLGPGFMEVVYEKALAHELKMRGIEFKRQAYVPIHYTWQRFTRPLFCPIWLLLACLSL